jgi:lipopolysaccharide export system protein LptA
MPITITANSGTFAPTQAEFIGPVHISQGSIQLDAASAKVIKSIHGIDSIQFLGGSQLVHFTQISDDQDVISGYGKILTYNALAHQVILTGTASIKKGNNLVMGDKLIYNTLSQSFRADGDINRNRVTIVLQPNTIGKK